LIHFLHTLLQQLQWLLLHLLLVRSLELALAKVMAAVSHHASLLEVTSLVVTTPRLKSGTFVSAPHFSSVAAFLTSVAGSQNVKLDLAFALLAYQSALATADSNEAVRLGTEAAAFLDRNNRNRLEPVHEITYKKGGGIGKTSTAYALTSLIGHASRGRTVHSGDLACEQCQRGNGNFADCVTVAGHDGSLFSGSCTNCAFPNRYKGCSFFNGAAIGPRASVAPTANAVATRAITRPRALTQPSGRRTDVQVVIPAPVATPSPVASREATPSSVADSINDLNISATPSRGHSRTQSSPAAVQDITYFEITIDRALQMSPVDQAAYVYASIGGWRTGSSRAPAWSSGSGVVTFEMLINPSYYEGRLPMLAAVHEQDREAMENQAIGPNDFVTLTSYGQATLGANSMRTRCLVFLYRRYMNEWRERRNVRYSSESDGR
jgi:hypothetical protein